MRHVQLLVALMLLPQVGQAAERDPCRSAKKADTVEGWTACVSAATKAKDQARARERLDVLMWARAEGADSSVAYRAYLAQVQGGAHAEEARSRAEDRAYREAVASPGPDAVERYLVLNPAGAHADQARELLDLRWVERARAENTLDAWGRYVVRYPRGIYADEAKARRDDLTFEALSSSGLADGYVRYLGRYPSGEHAEAAREALASLQMVRVGVVVLVRSHWREDGARRAAEADLKAVMRREGLAALQKRGFPKAELLSFAREEGEPLAAEWQAEPGRGLLVVRVAEREGQSFAPYGSGVQLVADVEVWPAGASQPAARFALDVGTPDRVRGTTVDALHHEGRVAFAAGLGASAPLAPFVPGARAEDLK